MYLEYIQSVRFGIDWINQFLHFRCRLFHNISILGFGQFIPDNFEAIFDAFVDDNPENAIAQRANGRRTRTGGQQAVQGGLTQADKAYMMKYLQLKFVILFQQKNKFVGKYCFYGCWCFPQAAMFQWQGFGQPVDNIGKIIQHIVG